MVEPVKRETVAIPLNVGLELGSILQLECTLDTKLYNLALQHRVSHYNRTGKTLHGNILKGNVENIASKNHEIRDNCDVKRLKQTAVSTKALFASLLKRSKGQAIENVTARDINEPYFNLTNPVLDLKSSTVNDTFHGPILLDKIAVKNVREKSYKYSLKPLSIKFKRQKLYLVLERTPRG